MNHKIKLLQTVKTPGASYPFGALFDFSKELMAWIRGNKINYMVFEVKNVSE